MRWKTVACGCQGRNPGCVNCMGTGEVKYAACKRCDGTGTTGGSSKCLDCRGNGWRDVELLGSI